MASKGRRSEDQKRYAQEIIGLIRTHVVTSMATAQATEVADLQQKHDVANDASRLLTGGSTRRKVCLVAVSICKYDNISMTLRIV